MKTAVDCLKTLVQYSRAFTLLVSFALPCNFRNRQCCLVARDRPQQTFSGHPVPNASLQFRRNMCNKLSFPGHAQSGELKQWSPSGSRCTCWVVAWFSGCWAPARRPPSPATIRAPVQNRDDLDLRKGQAWSLQRPPRLDPVENLMRRVKSLIMAIWM